MSDQYGPRADLSSEFCFLSASPFLLEIGTSHYFQGSVMGRCDHDVGSAGVSGSQGGRCDHDVACSSELRQTGSSKISVLCHSRLQPVIAGSW